MRLFGFVFVIALTTGTLNSSFAQASTNELFAIDNVDISGVRDAIQMAPQHGLNLERYWNQDLEYGFQTNPSDPRFVFQAKNSYIKLLKHLNSGTVNPEYLGKNYLLKQRKFPTPTELTKIVTDNGFNAVAILNQIAPRTPHYRSLQEALRRMTAMCSQNQWGDIPPVRRSLKLGDQDILIPIIKTRLSQFGYKISSFDDIFDQETLKAINNIQFVLHFKPDGVISPGGQTWKYLGVSCEQRIEQIKVDLEKLRWLPREFGSRYIYVNLAHNYLTLIDHNQKRAETMKVIEGRPSRQTPTLVDKITYITINPFWVVPPTVFKEDKLSDLRSKTPYEVQKYFIDNKYEVWDSSFKNRLDPASIDWRNVSSKTGIYIRQKPGLHNALGVLKFNLTNGDAIYLHDTNQRELFGEYERQLSSGCVRVERPFDLAEYLLQGTKYTRSEIEARVAKPGEVPLKDENVTTPNPIPVYMVFQTSSMNSDLVMRFAEDHYGQADEIRSAKLIQDMTEVPGLY